MYNLPILWAVSSNPTSIPSQDRLGQLSIGLPDYYGQDSICISQGTSGNQYFSAMRSHGLPSATQMTGYYVSIAVIMFNLQIVVFGRQIWCSQNFLGQFREIPWNQTNGCISRIYFDNAGDNVTLTLYNVTLTVYNVTLTSQKPFSHNNTCDCSITNGLNEVYVFFFNKIIMDKHKLRLFC